MFVQLFLVTMCRVYFHDTFIWVDVIVPSFSLICGDRNCSSQDLSILSFLLTVYHAAVLLAICLNA